MSNEYNFYNLEASFSLFLTSGNKKVQLVSVKNYKSDLRHFLGWLVLRLKSENLTVDLYNTDSALASFLTTERIAYYKAYLNENGIPLKTINRRLSTIRKFAVFCISQGWLKENPAKSVQNEVQMIESNSGIIKEDLLLQQFHDSLIESGLEPKEAKEITHDLTSFLSL